MIAETEKFRRTGEQEKQNYLNGINTRNVVENCLKLDFSRKKFRPRQLRVIWIVAEIKVPISSSVFKLLCWKQQSYFYESLYDVY